MRFDINEKALKKLVQPAMQDIARDMNREMQAIFRRYAGQPASSIKPVLRRTLRSYGAEVGNADLDKYAQMVSEGTQITFTA